MPHRIIGAARLQVGGGDKFAHVHRVRHAADAPVVDMVTVEFIDPFHRVIGTRPRDHADPGLPDC